MLTKNYEVEWSYLNKSNNYCYTEFRTFKNAEEQQAFAFEKLNDSNTYEVRVVTTDIWKKEL